MSLHLSAAIRTALCLVPLICPGKNATCNLRDTIKMKEIVVTADKVIKEESGKTISRIDSTAMINSLTANLSELISKNTPVFIKEYGRGALATASFRGTAPSHTTVTWNGMELNTPMLGMVDFSTIPVYFIDDVTLLHGSSSLSEKNGALGGTVKLQNSVDWQNKFSGRLLTGFGSYGTIDEFYKISAGNSRFQIQSRAYYNSSKNDFSFLNKLNRDPGTNADHNYSRERNRNAQYKNYGSLQEIYFHPSGRNIFNVKYWYQRNDRSLPKLLTNESGENSNINRQIETDHRVLANWSYYGRKSSATVSSGLNVQFLKYWLKNIITGEGDQMAINSISKSSSWYNKIKYSYQFKNDLSVILGIDADIHHVISQNFPQNGDTTGYNKLRRDISFFIQLSKKFSNKLFSCLMARQNYTDGNPTPVMPSASIEFHPFNNPGFFIKTNIALNYHQPSLNDLFYIPGGNPDLMPEEGFSVDSGTGYSFTADDISFRCSVNGFASQISNWIIWLPSDQGFWVPSNMKKVNVSGCEINTGLEGRISKLKYQLNGNYSYTRSINHDRPLNWADESIGKQLPFIPVHSGNLLADVSRRGFHITWSWNYYSKRYITTSSDRGDDGDGMDYIYPYIMNNLFIGKEIIMNKRKINVEVKIFNLLNEEYRTVLQIPMPGRNYSIFLRYDF